MFLSADSQGNICAFLSTFKKSFRKKMCCRHIRTWVWKGNYFWRNFWFNYPAANVHENSKFTFRWKKSFSESLPKENENLRVEIWAITHAFGCFHSNFVAISKIVHSCDRKKFFFSTSNFLSFFFFAKFFCVAFVWSKCPLQTQFSKKAVFWFPKNLYWKRKMP